VTIPFRPTLSGIDRLIARLQTRAEAGDAEAGADAGRLLQQRAAYRRRQQLARMAKQAASVEDDPGLW
jgi:hypothetical protein